MTPSTRESSPLVLLLNPDAEMEPGALAQLRQRFVLNEDVFRTIFTVTPIPKDTNKGR